MGLGHVTVRCAGARSTLQSSSLGLHAGREPFKNMNGLPKLPRRHTALLHAALRRGREARLCCRAQGLLQTRLRAPAANTWPGLSAATALEVTPGSSQGCKPRLRTIARESVRLRFQLRRLLRICLAVCERGREETSRMVWFGGGGGSRVSNLKVRLDLTQPGALLSFNLP